MNPIDRFNTYLDSLVSRMRWKRALAGAAILTVAAVALTLALVEAMNRMAFSETSLFWARWLLFLGMGTVIAAAIIAPLVRVNQKRAADAAEEEFPEFDQKLLTLYQATDRETNPFYALLARDVARISETATPASVVKGRPMWIFASVALLGVLALSWMISSGPGYLGYGAGLLWAGPPKDNLQPFYSISVQPGDRRVRRGSDQIIEAQLLGFEAQQVQLFAKHQSASKWEALKMERAPSGTGYQFLFAGLTETMDYYVEAGAVRSKPHTLTVVDLPGVKKLKVTYHYPAWIGLKDSTEDPGGDLRAVEGTDADVTVETDRPLTDGQIVLDDGTRIPLKDGMARVPIRQDGSYHIAAMDEGESVRISDDYFIEARKESAPTVKITRPGRDAKVSPIEEVTVEVEAADDFGLSQLQLHYSVNGGPEQTVALLPKRGVTEGRGSTTIALEDHKLVPGDVLALYATARDARTATRSDMYFIETQPFEFEVTQSQTMGGGGGGGGGQNERISQRQKEVIAATWNEIRGKKNRAAQEEDSKFLSGVQQKLGEQARSLAKRMTSRDLTSQNQEFQTFAREMESAAQTMNEAVEKIKSLKWRDALVPEQKALQHLLRAEAVFRQIQVAFGNQGGGGGGGGMTRDLENLFDLELDTEKNQYETGQSSQAEQQARQVDEALKKLEELARRQQELAAQQEQKKQSFQQRWAQEMLRRETEELKRRVEEMSRGNQQSQQQGQQGQRSSQQSGGQGSSQGSDQQSSQSGQQSASASNSQNQPGQPQESSKQRLQGMAGQGQGQTDPRLERALQQLQRATEDMRRATQQSQSGQAGDVDARRAAERMGEARDLLGGMRRQEAGDQMSDLVNRSQRLADQQKAFEEKMRQSYGGQTPQQQRMGVSRETAERLGEEKAAMQREFERLEQDLQQAARGMANSQRSSASRLRDAVGQAQQDELKLRMKFGSEWIRRGLGPQVLNRERPVTEGLQRLAEGVKGAQQAMGESPEGKQDLARSLDQLGRLRTQMDQLSRGNRPGQQGNQQGQEGGQGQQGQQGQPGQGQQGNQPGQQPGQQSGQQQGQGGQQGQQGGAQQGQGGQQGSPQGSANSAGQSMEGGARGGQWNDGYAAMNRGDRQGPNGQAPERSADPRALEQAYSRTMRQLQDLRSAAGDDPQVGKDVESLIREMQRLDPKRFPGNPALLERMRSTVLPNLEQIELKLRRQIEGGAGGQVRSVASEKTPDGYSDAVAEYFRRLSRKR